MGRQEKFPDVLRRRYEGMREIRGMIAHRISRPELASTDISRVYRYIAHLYLSVPSLELVSLSDRARPNGTRQSVIQRSCECEFNKSIILAFI
jgi:hypothetical protein